MINVCIPVLRRYDLLRNLLASLKTSTVQPDYVRIINNGRDESRLKMALSACGVKTDVYIPKVPLGVAESWNWFIQNVPQERIISNDDVTFAPESIGKIVASEASLVWASGFSCFLLRDECVRKVGLFDEEISPGYGYYEDEDYLQRLDGRGTKERVTTAETLDCGVVHFASGTLKAGSHEELMDHHRRFKIAQANYAKKWNVVFA